MAVALMALFTSAAFAQDAPLPVADTAPSWVLDLVIKYPWLATVVTVMGIMRLVVKPAMVFFHEVVKATPSVKDDELLAKVESSPVLKWFLIGLDWFASVKIVHPKATV